MMFFFIPCNIGTSESLPRKKVVQNLKVKYGSFASILIHSNKRYLLSTKIYIGIRFEDIRQRKNKKSDGKEQS
jgi:hypothetical protein